MMSPEPAGADKEVPPETCSTMNVLRTAELPGSETEKDHTVCGNRLSRSRINRRGSEVPFSQSCGPRSPHHISRVPNESPARPNGPNDQSRVERESVVVSKVQSGRCDNDRRSDLQRDDRGIGGVSRREDTVPANPNQVTNFQHVCRNDRRTIGKSLNGIGRSPRTRRVGNDVCNH